MSESKYVCMNCLIELTPDNSTIEPMDDNIGHVFCDKCGNEGIDVNLPYFDGDKLGEVTKDNLESWGMTEKENDKIYSKMHCESNLSDTIIGIFACSIIIYFLLKLIECIFYSNVF